MLNVTIGKFGSSTQAGSCSMVTVIAIVIAFVACRANCCVMLFVAMCCTACCSFAL